MNNNIIGNGVLQFTYGTLQDGDIYCYANLIITRHDVSVTIYTV